MSGAGCDCSASEDEVTTSTKSVTQAISRYTFKFTGLGGGRDGHPQTRVMRAPQQLRDGGNSRAIDRYFDLNRFSRHSSNSLP